MNFDYALASSQILTVNPILDESQELKDLYYGCIRRCVRKGKWNRQKYPRAELSYYKTALCASDNYKVNGEARLMDSFFSFPFDLAAILGNDKAILQSQSFSTVLNKFTKSLPLDTNEKNLLLLRIRALANGGKAWEKLNASDQNPEHRKYYSVVRKNLDFLNMKPFKMIMTANMSAGKSTLINALAGENLTLAQNAACTSKIHNIISKSFYDGIISEDDSDLVIQAGKDELLNDNEHNQTNTIRVGAFFHGALEGKRFIIYDSPGVNSSENREHTSISQRMLSQGRYNLILYVLNATQLSTDDESEHLQYIAKNLNGKHTIFILNKIDGPITDGENIAEIIERQKTFLVSFGFPDPLICPVSSRAAFLAKKGKRQALSRLEQRDFENFCDKFGQCSLTGYYGEALPKILPPKSYTEADKLLTDCGLAYIENLIKNITEGGWDHATGIR